MIDALKRLDCYLTDKWTGRPYMYYSAVLGAKQQKHGGSIPWSEHFGQALVSRILDTLDKDHCKKAITAKLPEYATLRAEINTLERLLAITPAGDVLDRLSIKSRIDSLKDEMK